MRAPPRTVGVEPEDASEQLLRAEGILDRLYEILLEASFMEFYESQPLAGEVIAHLRAKIPFHLELGRASSLVANDKNCSECCTRTREKLGLKARANSNLEHLLSEQLAVRNEAIEGRRRRGKMTMRGGI